MLIKFSVENYLSFKDKIEFSFEAAAIKEHPDHVLNSKDGRYKLLNGALIYGHNGSGKSNLISAITFMRDFVINSSKEKQAKERISIEEFKLSTLTVNKPSFFEIEIIFDETKYRYGFRVDENHVWDEWLFVSHKVKEYQLFSRTYDEFLEEHSYEIDPKFKESDPVNPDITRKNALLLSVLAQFNGEVSIQLVEWFQKATFVSGTNYMEFIDYTAKLLSDETKPNETILGLLRNAKLGFSNVNVKKKELTEEMLGGIPRELKSFLIKTKQEILNVKTIHTKRDHQGRKVGELEFDLMTHESLGSQKFFALVGPIYKALLEGSLLIIDELDARLHSNLSRLIIEFYQLPVNNPKQSQFIFSTHNTQFMDKSLFRRDQLFLIDKSELDSSFLYSIYGLNKVKPDAPAVRNDASFEKDYLDGKYGAVPFGQNEGRQLNIWELAND